MRPRQTYTQWGDVRSLYDGAPETLPQRVVDGLEHGPNWVWRATHLEPCYDAAQRRWLPQERPPHDCTWCWVYLWAKPDVPHRAHWAEGGGEEQPAFRGWFVGPAPFTQLCHEDREVMCWRRDPCQR